MCLTKTMVIVSKFTLFFAVLQMLARRMALIELGVHSEKGAPFVIALEYLLSIFGCRV